MKTILSRKFSNSTAVLSLLLLGLILSIATPASAQNPLVFEDWTTTDGTQDF